MLTETRPLNPGAPRVGRSIVGKKVTSTVKSLPALTVIGGLQVPPGHYVGKLLNVKTSGPMYGGKPPLSVETAILFTIQSEEPVL